MLFHTFINTNTLKAWIVCILLPVTLFSNPSPDLTTLYNSLDRHSIAQLFAFYHLYPDTSQGKRALSDAWELIYYHKKEKPTLEEAIVLPEIEINAMIALVNKQPFETITPLTESQLSFIEKVSNHLSNRKLKGFTIWDKNLLFTLPLEEIDLARALFLYQFENDPLKVRQYEANLDLIAIQILARLPLHASHEEKIYAINHFIFNEKRFRFPPHSLWPKNIDLYTFLPSVIDNRLGVCLGVSILYLSIAQRLNLPLEIITPPGHIFLRCNTGTQSINIETTSRGVHLPDKIYLGINTRTLQRRTIKEVIGLSFINQAATYWQKKDHKTTVDLYEQALPYMPYDPMLKMFLGYNYLFIDRIKEGKDLLEEVRDITFDYTTSKEVTPADFLDGKIDIQGIQAIFSYVDDTRQSILNKQQQLKSILKQFPDFRDGIFQLATTYLQLGRNKEAYETLNHYHSIDPTNPVVEYYLSVTCLHLFQYDKAWHHFKQSQALTDKFNHTPLCLKELYIDLCSLCADPEDHVHAH